MRHFFKRHRYKILVLLIAAIVLARVGLMRLVPQGSWIENSYYRIEIDMTEAEVAAILGPANHDTAGFKAWVRDDGVIMLTFDKSGRVAHKEFGPLHVNRPIRPFP